MAPWTDFKNVFNLSKNTHCFWIHLKNAISKAWKENIYKVEENFYDLAFSGYNINKIVSDLFFK